MVESMLSPWVKGNESITPKDFYNENKLDFQRGAFLGIDQYVELYEACNFDSGNLEDSWISTRKYIENAFVLINEDLDDLIEEDYLDISLDNEEKDIILRALGEPPKCSYNIYIVTIYNNNEERIVYIGKTDFKKSRFANGHMVALKLHNPKYCEYRKRVYFGTLVFLDKEGEYKPLEYVSSLESARKILGYSESILIRHFKPELNKLLVNTKMSIPQINLHIQNITDTAPFLNNIFIYD